MGVNGAGNLPGKSLRFKLESTGESPHADAYPHALTQLTVTTAAGEHYHTQSLK